MKKIIVLAILAFCHALTLDAQQIQQGSFATYTSTVAKNGDQISMTIDADMHGTRLSRQQMVEITPVLTSSDGKQVRQFAPVVVAGPKRYKMTNRLLGFGKYRFNPEPQEFSKFRNRHGDDFVFNLSIPYEAWMRDAKLIVNEEVSGCPGCGSKSGSVVAYSPALPPLFVPEFRISYVMPPAEPEKQRSETHAAYIHYKVGQSVILRDFKNNAQTLDEVSRIMTGLINDKDLTVTNFKVTGYASPDGNFQSNQRLSEARAQAFLNYLKENYYGAHIRSIHSEGRGEDWDGLRKAVEKSFLADRDQILSVIDIPDIDRRKAALKSLSGGRTYRLLLDEYFPPLRRNEYEVSYVARPFDVEEAKEIIRTRPQLLSLNEMFLVAHSYPKGSEGFKNVFDVAARMYPENPYANLNSGALEVEIGAYSMAIQRLQHLDAPEALNNLGVAHAKLGETGLAASYFRRAAAAGSADGSHNLDQLEQYLEN